MQYSVERTHHKALRPVEEPSLANVDQEQLRRSCQQMPFPEFFERLALDVLSKYQRHNPNKMGLKIGVEPKERKVYDDKRGRQVRRVEVINEPLFWLTNVLDDDTAITIENIIEDAKPPRELVYKRTTFQPVGDGLCTAKLEFHDNRPKRQVEQRDSSPVRKSISLREDSPPSSRPSVRYERLPKSTSKSREPKRSESRRRELSAAAKRAHHDVTPEQPGIMSKALGYLGFD